MTKSKFERVLCDLGSALNVFNWREVRSANVPSEIRRSFESSGENRIRGMFIGPNANLVPDKKDDDLLKIFQDEELTQHARQWLFEQQDKHERKEQRLETVEVAILLFLVLEVVHDYGPWVLWLFGVR